MNDNSSAADPMQVASSGAFRLSHDSPPCCWQETLALSSQTALRGSNDGSDDGSEVGLRDGKALGWLLGLVDGTNVKVGVELGLLLGSDVGDLDDITDGRILG